MRFSWVLSSSYVVDAIIEVCINELAVSKSDSEGVDIAT